MGLGAERLLAGLGTAGPADTATAVTLRVDQLRHESAGPNAFAEAAATGAAAWLSARSTLAAADPGAIRSAALRQLWVAATRTVDAAGVVDPALASLGPARRAYLTACWLRRAEIDSTLS